MNKILVYHEVSKGSVDSILKEGLKRSQRDPESSEDDVAKVESRLDEARPKWLQEAEIGRTQCLYGFVAMNGFCVDIEDGSVLKPDDLIRGDEGNVLLQLKVDPDKCFIAELDAHDYLVETLKRNIDEDRAPGAISAYWQTLIPLSAFMAKYEFRENRKGVFNTDSKHGFVDHYRRPEVLIGHDVETEDIQVYGSSQI